MLQFLLHLHSGLRWLVVLIAVVSIIKYFIGWIAKQQYSRFDTVLMTSFRILIDIQVLIGITVFIGMGVAFGFPSFHFKHGFTLFLALIMLHSTARRWDNTHSNVRFRNSLLVILAALVLIAVGIAFLPQGWSFARAFIPK